MTYQAQQVSLRPADPIRNGGGSGSIPNNLPCQHTTFIGRKKEIAKIKRLLPDTALLTLTGASGCGKTRLAIEVAARLCADREYPDGVWLVELGPLTEPALVPSAVAAALGIGEPPNSDLIAKLSDSLRSQQTLLVLDGCEHLAAACDALTGGLLTVCPHVRILATSREPLGSSGELPYRVPSLSLPESDPRPAGDKVLVSALVRSEAVRLFVDRVPVGRSRFALTPKNAPLVAQVCRRLDGIPLAIELAARHVKHRQMDRLAARLNKSFRLLTGGSKTALTRQQTLMAVIDSSYDLLSSEERRVLRRLSVFAGGTTHQAAVDICSDADLPPHVVSDLLTAVVARSLVAREERLGEEWYRLHDMVRQYGQEKLVDEREAAAVRGRHRDWYLRLAERAERELQGPEEQLWLERLDREHDNLRAALQWSRETDRSTGLRLAAALWRFWGVRGYVTEGRARLEDMLATGGGGESTAARAQALLGAGILAHAQGSLDVAQPSVEESLAIFRQIGDKRGTAAALNGLGLLSQGRGNLVEARDLYERSLAISREAEDAWGVAASLHYLGRGARPQGDLALARRLLKESVDVWRQVGYRRGSAFSLLQLGLLERQQGEYQLARTHFEEGLSIFKEFRDKWNLSWALCYVGLVDLDQYLLQAARLHFKDSLKVFQGIGDKFGSACSLNHLGEIALVLGDYDEACSRFEEGLSIFRAIEDKWGIALSLYHLGLVRKNQGNLEVACSLLDESLAIRRELGLKLGMTDCLEGLAGVAARQGHPERAAKLFGSAEASRMMIGTPRSPAKCIDYDRDLATTRAGLDEATFTAAWEAGKAMSLEQATAYAQNLRPDGCFAQ